MRFLPAAPVNAGYHGRSIGCAGSRAKRHDFLSGVVSCGFEPMNNFLAPGERQVAPVGARRPVLCMIAFHDDLRSGVPVGACCIRGRAARSLYFATCCLRSSARAPLKLFTIPQLPSWQAYSKIGPLILVIGISALQGRAQVAGSSTVNW